MSFGSPLWFCLLPFVLILPWLRHQNSAAFPSLKSMRIQKRLRLRMAFLSPLLLSSAGFCLVFALARPQAERTEQVVEKEGIDILLVVDTSGSMEVEDYRLNSEAVSRMDVSKSVLNRFVASRKNDRIGLVVFGEEAYTQCPLTLDHRGMRPFLDQIEIGLAGARATAIGDGMAVAGQRLKELDSLSRVMILLTDGQSNSGTDPMVVAKALADLEIRVYTIGLGSDGGTGGLIGLLGPRSDLDEEGLTKIARMTGGQYFRAQDTATLRKVYAEIDRLEPSTVEFSEFVLRDEKFLYWALSGMLLFFLNLLLGETWLRRLP